ncbi:MAG: type II secretion system F family protein [Nitrospinae bacterium]|nr:type II secretion system F family protein [Nitrospinota bacterium]
MAEFEYKFKTKVGVQKGDIEADSLEAAQALLKKLKITPLSIKPKPKDLLAFLGGGQPSQKDVVVFVRQFATMINAGLPLVQCLDILGTQGTNKVFNKTIMDIKGRIEQGDTFADSLRRHPQTFDSLFCNMIEAGEIGGILDVILLRLAAYIEKAMTLKGKVKSALVYPVAIMVVAVSVVAFLLIFIIPQFATMFNDMGGMKLPAVTLSVIWLSNVLVQRWYMFVGIPIALYVGLGRINKTEKGKMMTDTFLLKLPVVGMLIQKVSVAKFTRTMGTLISSGVPIIEGLSITSKTAGNKVIEKAITEVIEDIKQGKGLGEPLREQGVFPPMVVQMIDVGEQSGALDTMMNKIADFYDQEVDDAVESLTSLLEPMLMVFLAVVVGYVVIAMYMPIFKMGAGVT